MAKQVLTVRGIEALKPAPAGKRYEVLDATVPGLAIRVTEREDKIRKGKAAHLTFILIARYPGSANPTRRKLARYGVLTIDAARAKARRWLDMIDSGVDPADEKRRAVEAETEKRDLKFGVVVEDFIARHLAGQRRAADVERDICRELVSAWKNKPIAEITRRDVVQLIEAIADRPAPYMAHIIFSHIRVFFNWAINRGIYGLETSPADRLKPATLIGAKQPRQRVLDDDEIRAFWRASHKLPYPFGPMYKLLVQTGQRRSECSAARWREIDFENRLWTVPPERFKSGSSHLVPLTNDAISILQSLPRFDQGDHLFSTSFGKKPVSGFSKHKQRLDRRMLIALRAIVRSRDGADAGRAVELEAFVIHDLRRTMRTRLSSLRVPDAVAEMLIGHGRKGLQRVYDQHQYIDEMSEAAAQWAGLLRRIVAPRPDNVVSLDHMRG